MRKFFENERVLVGSLVLLCLVLYIPNLGNVCLSGKHESLYAEVAREMLVDGQWIVLHCEGRPYTEKPPLYFWLVAVCSIPNGDVSEFTARLPAALSAIGTVIVTFYLGRRLLNVRVAFFGALMLASCFLFQVYGRMARLDTTFTFFISASLLAFYSGYTSSTKTYYFLFWFLIAAAVLTKGLLGLFLALGPIALYLFWNNDLKALREVRFVCGSLIFILVILTWLLLVFSQKETGDYLKESIFVNSGLSYIIPLLKPKHHHSIFYFLGYYFYGMVPWSIFLPIFLYHFFSERRWRLDKQLLFLIAWLLVMSCTFALMGEKRHTYFLPLYPPTVLLIATWWDDLIERSSNIQSSWWLKVLGGSLAIMLGVEIVWVCQCVSTQRVIIFAFTLFLILSLGFFLYYSQRYRELFIFMFLIAASAGISYNQIFLPGNKEEVVHRAFLKELNSSLGTGTTLAVYGNDIDYKEVLFYSKRRIKVIGSIYELEEFFRSDGKVYCLMKESNYSLLSSKVGIHLVKAFPEKGVLLVSKIN